MFSAKPASTPLRCPKCRSRSMSLTETIAATTTWDVIDGRLDFEDGVHEFGGAIGNVDAQCSKCGHRWTTRKLVNGLIFEDDPTGGIEP